MKDKAKLAGELLKEAQTIYYSHGKEKTTRSAARIIAEAETIGPEVNLGIDLGGISSSELEAEATRYLPLVVKGLILYLNRRDSAAEIAGRYRQSIREAEQKVREYEKYQADERDRLKARKEAKDEYTKTNKEEIERQEKERTEERTKLEKAVNERLEAEDAYKVLKVSRDASQEEIEKSHTEEMILRNRESAEIEMRMSGDYSESEIEEKLLEYDQQRDEIESAYNQLKDKTSRDAHDAHLESIKSLADEPIQDGFVIKFIPVAEQSKERTNALKATEEFRENIKFGWGVDFDHEYIENLKKGGFIPRNYTDQEANNVVNIATLVYSKVGNAQVFQASLDKNTDLTPEQKQRFQIVANHVGFLQVANPVQARNLYIAAGSPSSDEINISKGNVYNVRNDENQIALKFDDNNVLSNVFEKLKIEGSKIFNTDIAENLKKTHINKDAKKLALKLDADIEKLNSAIDSITSKLSSLGTIGKALAIALKGLRMLFGKLFIGAYRAIARFVNDNKEFMGITGTALTIGGILTGSMPMLATGLGFLSSLAATIGPALVPGLVVTSIGFAVVAVVTESLAFIAWIIISFIFLVTFTTFIINNGAYVVTPSTLLGFGAICSSERTPVSFPAAGPADTSSARKIEDRAWGIVDDLYQGFWCYWNRSPGDAPGDTTQHPKSYPELFNYPLYQQNPYPSRTAVENDASNLFWCTQLVNIAYKETGNPQSGDFNSERMLLWFKDKGRFYANNTAMAVRYLTASIVTAPKIVPGSVIFFQFSGGPNRANHVAIVHHKTCITPLGPCSIDFVQANAGDKQGNFTYNPNPLIGASYGGAEVLGFGTP